MAKYKFGGADDLLDSASFVCWNRIARNDTITIAAGDKVTRRWWLCASQGKGMAGPGSINVGVGQPQARSHIVQDLIGNNNGWQSRVRETSPLVSASRVSSGWYRGRPLNHVKAAPVAVILLQGGEHKPRSRLLIRTLQGLLLVAVVVAVVLFGVFAFRSPGKPGMPFAAVKHPLQVK
jgi:hypothetical protein